MIVISYLFQCSETLHHDLNGFVELQEMEKALLIFAKCDPSLSAYLKLLHHIRLPFLQ